MTHFDGEPAEGPGFPWKRKQKDNTVPGSVTYDAGEHLIIVTFRGAIDATMTDELISEVIGLAKQHACFRILSDFREACVRFSIMEIFDLPASVLDKLRESGFDVAQFTRALVAGQDWSDFYFFETVARNRAHNVMLFRELEEAKKWVLGT